MKKELLNYPLSNKTRPPLVLCLGYFDGIHVGHQQLIERAIELGINNAWETGLMTFDPSPDKVLGKTVFPNLLTTLQDREEILSKMGIHQFLVLPFTLEIAHLSRAEFIEKVLLPLNVQAVVCGFDFHYGFKGEGNSSTLEQDAQGRFLVEVIPPILAEGSKISSTRIHENLMKGDIIHVTQYLGRPYQVKGIVQAGYGNGVRLGYPTANIKLVEPYELPRQGVYAVRVTCDEKVFGGMANIGIHPTIQPLESSQLEVHIFDLNKDLYQKHLSIEFIGFVRNEMKFSSLVALKDQLKRDERYIREMVNDRF